MFGLGTGEIILIVIVVLLLFGGKKIPELMKGLGKGVRSFKDECRGWTFKDGMKAIDLEDEGKKDDAHQEDNKTK